MKRNKTEIGYIGETYVIAKLIRDFNIISIKVPDQFFSYDLITNNHKRIEVKTATLHESKKKYQNKIYSYESWIFRRNDPQLGENESDFIVCVCFEKQDFSDEPHCFIIPSKMLRDRSEAFRISVNQNENKEYNFWEYENNWDPLINDSPKKNI